MQTFREPHYGRKGRLSISDPSYDTTKRKKKALKDFNDAEVSMYNIKRYINLQSLFYLLASFLREAGQTEDEIYLQKIEAEYVGFGFQGQMALLLISV